MRVGGREGERHGRDAVDALHGVGASLIVVLLLAAAGGSAPLGGRVGGRGGCGGGAAGGHRTGSGGHLVQIGHAAAQMTLSIARGGSGGGGSGGGLGGHGGLGPLLGFRWPALGARHGGQVGRQGAVLLSARLGQRLAAAHRHDVVVAARDVLVEEAHDVVVQPFLGHVARQAVHVVGDVAVGVVVEQGADGLEGALARRQEERRLVFVVLSVFVGAVRQQDVDGVEVVDGGGPVQRRLALIVGGVDVDVGVDQVLDHALDGQAGGQDEWRGAVVHARVEVGGSVAQKDLEDPLGVRGHGGVQRRPARVVLGVGVGAGLEQSLGGVGAGVAGRQVERRLARLVHGGVGLGALHEQVLDDGRRAVLFVVLARIQSVAAVRGDHERRETVRSAYVHLDVGRVDGRAQVVVGRRREGPASLSGVQHLRLAVAGTDVGRVQVLLRPRSRVVFVVLGHGRLVGRVAALGRADALHRRSVHRVLVVGPARAVHVAVFHVRVVARHVLRGAQTQAQAQLVVDVEPVGRRLLVQVAHLLAVGSAPARRAPLAAVAAQEAVGEPGDAAGALPVVGDEDADEQRHHQDAQGADDYVRHLGEGAVAVRRLGRTGVAAHDARNAEVGLELVAGGRGTQKLRHLAGSREALGVACVLDALAVVDLQVHDDAARAQRVQVRRRRVLRLGRVLGRIPRVDHFVDALRVHLYAHGGAQLAAHVAHKGHALVLERRQVHLQHDRNGAHGQHRQVLALAVQAVPVAFGRVAARVAEAVGVVRLAVGVVDRIARLDLAVAVVAVEQALGRVALFVAFVVLEQFPAAQRRRAVGPRAHHAQRTIAAVKVAPFRPQTKKNRRVNHCQPTESTDTTVETKMATKRERVATVSYRECCRLRRRCRCRISRDSGTRRT